MDSSDRSNNISDLPNHRWAKILGNLIAIITLVLPLVAIASNSSANYQNNPTPLNYSPSMEIRK